MAGGTERLRGGRKEWTEDSGRYVMSVVVAVTGVDAYRIRRYERAGLLSPARTEGGQRMFSDKDIHRIREVSRLEAEGVNLKGIEVILRLQGGSEGMNDEAGR